MLLLGCAAHDDISTPLSLASPVIVTALGSASADSAVDFTLAGGDGAAAATVHVPVTSLYAQLATGAHPRLRLLTMPLAATDLGQLQLELDTTTDATVTRASDDTLDAQASAALALRANAPSDSVAAASDTIGDDSPMALSVSVTRTGNQGATFVVDGRCDGVCWQLPGAATVRDARLHASVAALVSPLE